MKRHSWLEWEFIKESFVLLFLNFHYIVLFSIFQLIFSVTLIFAGPAWIAMCRCLRVAAEGRKLRIRDYFIILWQFRGRGLLYSVVLGCGLIGVFFGIGLSQWQSGSELGIASVISGGVLLGLTIYVPFTLLPQRRQLTAFFDSAMYFFSRFSASVVLLSVICIFFLLSWVLTPVLTLLIMPGITAFFLGRTIVGNNEDMESMEK